ncbi:matrixin family metalloprotease [Denitratisoma oestradiolicum]|uniref:Serralysin G (Modular protein) n=1 Tax=Denitratisoma oestradiolicum TaxID=311182 RepID=A0A6S6XWG9_9PROT|nr:matrixin family metalloprotease [Denitratisoma oestradiolicum]TWO79322.1 hypothetical protein CBW56_15555 [Denitratisoma oestradiolicum]CAB1370349.1 Serralysin G (modular protein) [Denitratisoma oestradiolicum]
MTTLSDLTSAPRANADWIDALIQDATAPKWNFIVPFRTKLYYTFSVSAGTESQRHGATVTDLTVFNSSQQSAARDIMAYVSGVTGITFYETQDGKASDIHFANCDVEGVNTSGVCVTYGSYAYYEDGTVSRYEPEAYIYLDNREFLGTNTAPSAGSDGYQVLLHEVGHALGLKHPFEGDAILSASWDNTANTLMSYTDSGGPYTQFRQLDLAALGFLFGTDGLGGIWGVAAAGAYYQGTSSNDTFTSGVGRHTWIGMGGTDAVAYSGTEGSYGFSLSNDELWLIVDGGGSYDYVSADVEQLRFSSSMLSVATEISRLTHVVMGTAGDDALVGSSAADTLNGAAGNDVITGGIGDDLLDGGSGSDVVALSGNATDYLFSLLTTGDVATTGLDGTDTLRAMERVRFDGGSETSIMNLLPMPRLNAPAYQAKVQAYFLGSLGRAADAAELTQYTSLLSAQSGSVWKDANGQTGTAGSLVGALFSSAEFSALISGKSNAQIVDAAFQRLTGTTPTQDVHDYYTGQLDTSGIRVRGLMNAMLNDLALMPRLDGALSAPSGWPVAYHDSLTTTQYRGYLDHLHLDGGIGIDNLDANGNLIQLTGV